MLKWFSNEEGGIGPGAPGSPQGAVGGGEAALGEVADRLAQTEQLVTQLKELIRQKDGELRSKDEQLKTEKEAFEAKLSKMRLQNKAKVTSLTAKLDQAAQDSPTHSKKGGGEAGEPASRGKILLLRKKVEELEHHLSQRDVELGVQTRELEAQRQRGEEMDAMLAEKDRKLSEKEVYIVHLQTALSGEQPTAPSASPAPELRELQMLVQNLTQKVEEGEERCSLLQEQTDSLRELLLTEKHQYEEKENMYKQNIQTFKDIILQKDNTLVNVNQMHEQELFKLAAKSDASADLEQLLKALKQKLHEKEEVLLGKRQVIDVLQGEVDSRDQQIKDLVERARRLQVERESLHSKLEAEKHVMRAQLRDLMEKQQAELRRIADQHRAELAEAEHGRSREEPGGGGHAPGRSLEEGHTPGRSQEEGHAPGRSLEEGHTPGRSQEEGYAPEDATVAQRMAELEAQAKLKTEEASKSEARFLKMKAWSKSRIRQLEDELRKNQSESASPDVTALRLRISDLEEEREDILWKLEQYEEVKAQNGLLEAKLVVYEEQQRKMQADLEQVTKRAASQTSESGSADDAQSQVMEWQEMVSEAVTARDRAREEKATMVLRMSHMEEEREVLASRQQELEEELAQVRGLGPHRTRRLGGPARSSLQVDFEFDRQQCVQEQVSASETSAPMEGENMGEGLRSVVEELEVERNQLQEQMVGLEERCQDLEDRLQMQTRMEALQNESERLQGQLAVLRSQQSRDAEKHQLLVTSLNKQLKGLSDTQECLETSLIEKENTLAKTSEKLELIDGLQDSLKEKEAQHKDVSDKLLQTGHHLTEVLKKCSTFEKECLELKTAVADLTQKLSVLKEKTQKQEATIETLQTDLDQTNDELDKLNTAHLEERAQLIHDLQSCEREMDNLKDALLEKEKEISVLSGNMVEYAEQITVLKHEIKNKEQDMVRIESALTKAECEAQIGKDSQSSDQQALNTRMAELVEQLKDTENELSKVKEERGCKLVEVKDLTMQVKVDTQTIQDLRVEIQRHHVNHHNHLSECEALISSLKDQATLASQKLQESESLHTQLKENDASNEKLKDHLQDKEQIYEKELKSFKEERNELLAEVEKHKQDLQAISKQLEEQVECQEQVKRAMQEKLETIISLEEKVKIAEGERQKFSTELQTRNIEREQLGKELEGKDQNISKLKSLLKSMTTENQHLQTDLKGMTEDLESQKQHVDGLSDKLRASVEEKESLMTQINRLTEENQRLQLEVVERTKSISEQSNEIVSLLSKISAFETQQSEDGKIIKRLQKDKEDLGIRVHELNKVIELNKQSISETLLEKTNDCTNLTKMLRASEETVALLQEQVDKMNTEVEQLHLNMGEKEKTVADLKSQMGTQHSQQMQLQETLSLLQEQGNTLKAGLLEKDTLLKQKQEECHFLNNEVAQQKCVLSELQVVAETSKGECSQLGQLLKEREEVITHMTQECRNNKEELSKRNESVMALSSELGVMNKSTTKLESEHTQLKKTLEDHAAENNKLRQDMEQGQVERVGLHSHIKALSEQHHQLQTAYEIREKELAQQTEVAFELDIKVTRTLQQISDLSSQLNSLTEENHRLQQELTQRTESEFKLATERSLIQEKMSGLEMQHSENCTYIEDVLKDQKGLREAAQELSKVLEQNKQSLLEKTNECSHLTTLLQNREESIVSLQEQTNSMNVQIHQMNNNLADKDKTLTDQCTRIERQQTEVVQLQETLHLHQEQVAALKSGLTEKDTMLLQKTEECSFLESEMLLQKDRISTLQGEAESLRGECSELSRRLEEKEETLRHTEQEYQNHRDEQNTMNESVMLLSSKLDSMKENSAKLEIEVTELRAALETHAAENDKLRQEMDQKQTEVVELTGKMQASNKLKVRLKAAYQRSVTEASKSLEEMSALRTEISNRDSQMCTLTEQLKAACADKESLALTLQQKDDSLRQQEMFIKQLQVKSEEVEGQKMEVITELQTQAQSLQRSLQDREVTLHETERDMTLLREKLTSDSENLKTQLHSNAETITQLQGELTNLVEKNSKLSERITEQEVQLKQEAGDNVKLKDSILQFRGQVDNLTSESSLLKETLKDKEQVILENKHISSTVSNSLNSKLEAKESEFKSLKEQLSERQELISKLNITLHTQTAEITTLKGTLEEREATASDQAKALQDLHRRADEAALFKAQLMDSTELVSQLQSQIQVLSTGSANLSKSAEEKQSAFVSLQEAYATHMEELQEVRKELSQKTEDVSSLGEALCDSNVALQAAEVNAEALKNESSLLLQELQQLKTINFNISKKHEDALANHQRSTSSFTVEIERLKSQHLHVAAQVNALRENLEQRETDLHAISSQYTAQVKHTEHLLSETQKLEEQNTDLKEEMLLSKQEHQQHLDATLKEKEKLQKEVQKLITERDEVGRSHSHKIQTIQQQVQLQTQQQSSRMNEALEKMMAEKEKLQIEVSVRSEKITGLKSVIQKIEQTLQDSEKEWISVLERETQDKNLLVEQLKSVENEMKSKDFKVQSLKQDLDSLHEKLSEAASAIRQGSDQLKEKELEASASRVQLQKILASVLEKDRENVDLKQALQDMGSEVRKLEVSKECSHKDLSVLSQTMSVLEEENISLQTTVKQLRESHQSELNLLKGQLDKVSELHRKTELTLKEKEKMYQGESQQKCLLQEQIQFIQTQLQTEADAMGETAIKLSALNSEIQKRDDQISCMAIQLSQQKELFAGLSQQLREKDASVALVMESVSNERVKHAEENNSLKSQLESLENAHISSGKQQESMLLKLEEGKTHLSLSQSQIEIKNLENGELVKEKDHLKAQVNKLSKEKEAMKKKLQAALVVRKDLLKKIEEHGNQKELNVRNGIELLALQNKLQKLNDQAQVTTEEHEAQIYLLKQQLLQKEGELLELAQELSKRGALVHQLKSNVQTLQTKLDEQEVCLTSSLRTLNEKSTIIEQLYCSMSEKKEAFEHDQCDMRIKFDQLHDEMKKQEDIFKQELSRSVAAAVDLENELVSVKQEKAIFQKKAQAALLARNETMKKSQESEKKYNEELSELKNDHKCLLEQHCQQTNELNVIRLSYDQKAKELEDIRKTSLCNVDELETLRRLVKERDNTQYLQMALAGRESQYHYLSPYEAEGRQFNLENISEIASENSTLKTENEMGKSHLDNEEKEKDLARQKQAIQEAEQINLQEKQAMVHDNLVLQNHFMDAKEEHTLLNDTTQSLKQEKENDFMFIGKEEFQSLTTFPGEQPRPVNALLMSQTLVPEKEEQRQHIHLHEAAMETMRDGWDEMEDAGNTEDQDRQMKTAQTAKKIQAALISRREVMKENDVLKEQIETLSAKNKEMEASYSALKISVTNLKRQNENLESSVSSLSKKEEKIVAEIEGILNDNHNLSAACESLKLTIENITQQKQAFSFQLESLKDSQTEELSEWKSKHKELRQQYDSLLQAYGDVSSEVDKMRQLLEGARREKQDALFEAHTLESERESPEEQMRDMEEEKEKIKEKFSRTNQQNIEELEDMATVEVLTTKNQQLQAEIHSLKESSEELREKLTEIRLENGSLAEELKDASCSLEKWHIESRISQNSMQLKLDEAHNLNNSLTAQIKTQKTELAAQLEINDLMLKEKINISERLKQTQNDHEEELGNKDLAKAELQEIINRHSKEIISLNEKVRILEDDKSLLQEELENVQETKNQNEYLETMRLKQSEGIEELTESVSALQAQNIHLFSQLTASKEEKARFCQEKAEQELKLVKEFEEKLKVMQRGNEGSKNLKKELQELLKDKHHEINQLQRDCIKYQDLILDLQRSLGASQAAHNVLERELKEMTEVERRKRLEKELVTYKDHVSEARKEMASICSEKDVELSEKSKGFEFQVLEKAEQQKGVDMNRQLVLQKHIDELQSSKDTESKLGDLQINTLKREVETKTKMASLFSSTQGTVEGGLNATKGPEHEMRTLLHQMDDVNSENAMLRAQLIRYREDLNQVLSLKDNQLKELLKKQQDTIANLENQKATTEKKHKESLSELQREGEANNALKAEKADLQTQIGHMDTDMLALKKERAQTNEGKVIADLQQAIATKAAECNNLQQKLFAQKVAADELKNSMQRLENETAKKLTEAEDTYNSELEAFEREVELMRTVKETADQRLSELMQDILQNDDLLSEARGQIKGMKSQNESLSNAMVALQNDRDQLIEDFKIMQNRYDDELKESQAAMNKVERCLGDATSELATLSKERHILVQKLSALKSKDAHSQLTKLVDEMSKALSEKEGELKRVSLENDTFSRQVSAFSRSMASIQDDRDRLIHELMVARREEEYKQRASLGAVNSVNNRESSSLRSSIDTVQNERDGLETRKTVDELQRALQQEQSYRLQAEEEVSRYQAELAQFRSEQSSLHIECRALKEQHHAGEIKESMALVGSSGVKLQTERVQLQRDLQRCLYEIQQRDLHCQQLNAKLQEALEEKAGVAAQLRAVSQTLRDTQLNLGQLQNHCYWLESQGQASANQTLQGAVSMEEAPGAPQERSSAVAVINMDTIEAVELRASIQLETEEEWEALILNPNEPLVTRKVKGGVLACRRWLRGRSLYCSKLLTSRARSRYLFLAYLLTLHVAVLMCLTGAF